MVGRLFPFLREITNVTEGECEKSKSKVQSSNKKFSKSFSESSSGICQGSQESLDILISLWALELCYQ